MATQTLTIQKSETNGHSKQLHLVAEDEHNHTTSLEYIHMEHEYAAHK